MKNLIIVFLVIISSCTVASAQQFAQFSQIYQTQQLYNPAYAGVQKSPNITLGYRQQWIGFEGAPTSMFAAFNGPLISDRVGMGLALYADNIGIVKTWGASMAYSYKIPISDAGAVRFGFQGSIKSYQFDFMDDSFFALSSDDNSIAMGSDTKDFTGNFGVGIHATLGKMFIGASVPEFYPNEIGFNNDKQLIPALESPHWHFLVGGTFSATNKIKIRPALLVKYVKNAPFNMDINVTGIFDERIHAGIGYRLGANGSGESVQLQIMYALKKIGIGASYDFGISKFARSGAGSFELIAMYKFEDKSKENLANPRSQF